MDSAASQPPSGGCVLKLFTGLKSVRMKLQPPSGGCVLKHCNQARPIRYALQPPSGGCVLKQLDFGQFGHHSSAAFRRLCVETCYCRIYDKAKEPAAFRRLCVETIKFLNKPTNPNQPPSGGCVLKHLFPNAILYLLAAAFRRLCVETTSEKNKS